MNIIALSLGLAPIPPLPPAVRERQIRIADDRHRCTNVGRMTRQSATAYRAKLLQMLRDIGPATTSEVADYFNTTRKAVRAHLQRLCDDSQVQLRVEWHGSRRDYTWYVPEHGDA